MTIVSTLETYLRYVTLLCYGRDMSPRPYDAGLREAVLQAAARVLAEEGHSALTTRRVAGDVGVSTTSVYTYFGSMEELRREVRRDGFAKLDTLVDRLAAAADPVADLAAVAEVYFSFGIAEPHVYRAMFLDRPVPDDSSGKEVFERLVAQVARCVEAGRFRAAEPKFVPVWAAQLWSMRLVRLCTGYGDAPGRAAESVAHGMES